MQQQKPLEGAQLVIMTIALSLATFMQVLDSTIANVAIPTIAGNLGSSLSQGTWVITSFGVANAISIPITGWLAKRVGEVKLFPVVNHRLRHCLLGLRRLQQPDDADFLPRHSGDRRRTADPAVAKSAAQQLSPGEALYRSGAVVDDGDCRTHLRSDPRRLYQR